MGKIYLAEKKYGQARQQFSSALQLSKSSQQSAFQLESYYLLAQVSKMMNNRQEEILNMNQYLILKDSMEDLELAGKVERLQFEMQIESKEKEMNCLNYARHRLKLLWVVSAWRIFCLVWLSFFCPYWQFCTGKLVNEGRR